MYLKIVSLLATSQSLALLARPLIYINICNTFAQIERLLTGDSCLLLVAHRSGSGSNYENILYKRADKSADILKTKQLELWRRIVPTRYVHSYVASYLPIRRDILLYIKLSL